MSGTFENILSFSIIPESFDIDPTEDHPSGSKRLKITKEIWDFRILLKTKRFHVPKIHMCMSDIRIVHMYVNLYVSKYGT